MKEVDDWDDQDLLEETFDAHTSATIDECFDNIFPIEFKNGIILRRRTKSKIIRFRNYRLASDPENYFRERLMLYVPWRTESNIKQGHATYESCFQAHLEQVQQQMLKFEPMSSVINETMDQIRQDYQDQNHSMLAPSVQFEEEQYESHMPCRNQHDIAEEPDLPFDIGPSLGLQPSSMQDLIDVVPNVLTDQDYHKLIHSLNEKQFQFYTHIMQSAHLNNKQIMCALHGGAGTGKSTVLKAIYQGLYRRLCKQPGQNPANKPILLTAPTGKAAYNIKGTTLHQAFMIPANQCLTYKQLTFDNLNRIRKKFIDVTWILIDEFSMLGNKTLQFIHLRLQEIKQNLLPFGGLNIICVGDLYQLQPVMQRYIFESNTTDYGALATNLWTEHFSLFELDEIMRQQGDQIFAELLNRLRVGQHTVHDIQLLKECVITQEDADQKTGIPRFFPTRQKVIDFNEQLLQQSVNPPITIYAVDTPPTDVSRDVQKKILEAAKHKSLNATGNLPYIMTVKVGQLYDIIANINVEDGIMNGAECRLEYVEPGQGNFPRKLWVSFTDPDIGKETRKKIRTASRGRNTA